MRFEDNISRLGQLISAPDIWHGTLSGAGRGDPNRHIVLFSVLCAPSQEKNVQVRQRGEKLLLPRSVIFPSDQIVALSSRHERGAGSEREPGTVFISSTCMSHARFRCQRGSARVVESLRLAEQAASHSASRRASCQAGYQFLVAICVGARPCRGPPLPTALPFLQPLFLFRESCLTAAHRRWNEKAVTAASFPPPLSLPLFCPNKEKERKKSAAHARAKLQRWWRCRCWAPVTCCCLLLCGSPPIHHHHPPNMGARDWGEGGQGTAFV